MIMIFNYINWYNINNNNINDIFQTQELEKQAILEFESHLAAACNKSQITESNSLLLSQLMSMEPR